MPTPPPTPPYDTDQNGTTGPDSFPGTPGRDRYVGLDGDDFLRGANGDDVLIGDVGNDQLRGQEGNDYLEGGDGNDFLYGDNGDDTILGGAGDDFLRGGAGIDVIDGGDGNDRISFFELNQTQGVVADLAAGTMSNDGYGNSETIISIEGLGAGTRFVDTFLGSDGVNTLLGNSEDMISGRGGDDLLQIGASLTGGGTVDGGDGIDTLQFSDGYLADTNNDGLAELIPTTIGVIVNLGAPTNQVQNDGNGRQATILNVENLGGTVFNDQLIGNGGNNTLVGNGGNDVLVGLGGNNILQGGAGSDTLVDIIGGTNDILDGGEEVDGTTFGLDFVSYYNATLGSAGVTVSLALQGAVQTTGRGDDTLTGIEGLAGTRFADTLTGDDFDNALFGMGGADTINAAGGDDGIVVTGFGSVVDGGTGDDVVSFWTSAFSGIPNDIATGVTYDLSIGGAQASAGGTLTISNVENLSGSRSNDVLTGTAGDNALGGSFGDDQLNGGDGNDALYGDGTFFFDVTTATPSFIDEVPAAPGQPPLGIASGADVLNGGAGDDELFGGAGDDILTGGAGFDFISGGEGDDTVNFNVRTDGGDTVNLDAGLDEVNVSGGGEVRVTFSFGRAANGDPSDGLTPFPNSDGGLALRVQAEDAAGALTGDISRFDDEGMILRGVDGTKFDLRVLENGSPLGGLWDVVAFGTGGDDILNGSAETGNIAALGGLGNDSITGGSGNDYINGGFGFDTLNGGDGNDNLVDGGTGNKVIIGGAGQDRFFFNITLGGANSIDLGDSSGATGIDIVNIQGPTNIGQIRLTLDASAAGNDNKLRGDGNLAVEIQREDANGNLTGAISLGDDEHIIYNSPNGSAGFDIRDSITGEQYGIYSLAYLGGASADIDTALSPTRSYFYSLGGGDDVVTGGNLNDYMDGGIGNDTLTGGDGADILKGAAGNDTLDGGLGTDIAVFTKASTAYTVAAAAGGGYSVTDTATGEQDIVRNVETLRFSNGDFNPATLAPGAFPKPMASYAVVFLNGGYTVIDRETLSETALGNVPTISFADGTFNSADIDLNVITLPAGTTNDGRTGTPAGDYIVGNDGYNLINGGSGDDFILAGGNGGAEPSVDNIRGNDGNDTLVGGAGADLFRGGAGVDRFFGMGGNDRISFFEVAATQGAVADLETGIISNDGFGNVETFTGIEGLGGSTRFVDTFRGSAGNNLILADTADTVEARGGDDRIQLSGSVAGGGTIDGGDGFDFITAITADRQEDTNGDGIADSVAATQGVSIDLSQQRILNDGFGNQATLISIEGMGGGALNDTLVGSDGDNRINLTNGNDTIDGRGGIDTIDVVQAPRSDFTVIRSGPNSYTITDATGVNTIATNVEFIEFSDGVFALSSLVTGPGPGNDYVEGTAGPDTLDGLGGNDTIVGLDGDDTLSGSDGNDNVDGGNGNDTITGGTGADSLNGGSNNDTITAGDGSDTVIGGSGNDTIITGDTDGAADTYIAGTSPTTGASGLDVISYRTNTAGVTVSLALQGAAQNTGSEGMDTLHGFTRLEGGQGNDILTGNNQANLISGLGGDDTLDGGSLNGPNGALSPKLLDGGDGFDTAVFSGNRADYEFQYVAATGRINVIPLTVNASVGLVNIERVRFADGDFTPAQLNVIPTEGDDVLIGTRYFETINGLGGNDTIYGRGSGDTLNGGDGNDALFGGTETDTTLGANTDTLDGGNGDDQLTGGTDNDTITGGEGNDTAFANLATDGADTVNLGNGNDVAVLSGAAQIRLTFTSIEVGNDVANDSGTLANQDGGLAVRVQAEDGSDGLTGPVSRYDDEGISFVAGAGTTFDVRDLVSGVSRGNAFNVATLGTVANDSLTAINPALAYYFNAGMGNDSITGGTAADFLVGGSGDDTLAGGSGNDGLLGGDGADMLDGGTGNDTLDGGTGNDIVRGGDGNDSITDGAGGSGNQLFGDAGDDTITTVAGLNTINGGTGNDTVNGGTGTEVITHDMATGGSDRWNTGGGFDFITLTTVAGSETRITFTSSEVGNGSATDSNTMANQDGDLAVRIQIEGNSGGLFGPVSRGDDEGVFYTASEGSTIEIRDLVSGVSRGSFRTSFLGTSGNDTVTPQGAFVDQSYYMNGGMGNDTLNGSTVADFLVGGAGDDTLSGGTGDDQFLGGAGVDTISGGEGDDIITGGAGDDAITGGAGVDTAIANVATDGADSVNLGDGNDVVQVSGAGQIRLTFTSAEVGNGSATDSNTLANQDGGLAVRLQAEDGSDGLTGPVSRYDDEGVTFVAAAGTTFDVRDLPTGVARGDGFRVVTLGTAAAAETLTAVNPALSYYINGGGGRDTITGGNVADFLVGGADNDILEGGQGDDAMLGGAGIDRLVGGTGNDRLDGGAGTDVLEGGAGNDVYISDGIDVITEAAGEGIDEVISSGDAGLAANVENLTLVGAAINGSGNELGNIITGNDANNILRGNDGNDLLVGALGNDNLQGGNGNDVLDGGDGDDTLDGGALGDIMTGGAGNDLYQVDTVSDQVIEAIGGGTNDRIVSTVSYTLVGEVEVLNLVGAAAINGTGSETNNTINGNDLNNTLAGADGNDLLNGNNGNDVLLGGNGVDVLRGGEGDDSLDGGAGADSMSGGNGNDLYYIDNSADVVAEVAGGGTNDRALVSANWTVAREVEVATQVGTADLSLTGNLLDNMLNGNAGNNVIRGADGNDTILGNDGNDTLFGDAGADILRGGNGDDIVIGGAGMDQLQGGAGADIFRFTDAKDLGLTGATSDRILDFSSAQGDRIDVSVIDANANVAGNQAFTFIGSAAFSGTAGELRVQASGTNQLVYGDTNGDGVADFLIVVTPAGAVPLAGGDFTL